MITLSIKKIESRYYGSIRGSLIKWRVSKENSAKNDVYITKLLANINIYNAINEIDTGCFILDFQTYVNIMKGSFHHVVRS